MKRAIRTAVVFTALAMTGLGLAACVPLAGVVQISAGDSHTCAVLDDGRVVCWGSNNYGELGNDSPTRSSTPIEVEGITDATSVSAGSFHTCAVRATGTIACWGRNLYGELGNNTTLPSTAPVEVADITDAEAVSAGGGHTCATYGGGSVACWGLNQSGQIGNVLAGWQALRPVVVASITDATAIAAGSNSTCASSASGTIWCWGNNSSGQLGNGNTTDVGFPVPVTGIANATGVDVESTHGCATLADGGVACWGSNGTGELGDGTVGGISTTPVLVTGITDATSVAAGDAHSCARMSDATMRCWGYHNHGQLGHGPDGHSATPVTVLLIDNASTVTAGTAHNCAVRSDGSAACWGWNYDGQLGNGTMGFGNGGSGDEADSNVPVTVLTPVA